MESGETADAEMRETQPEQPNPIQDALVAYTLAAAGKRMRLDALIATWRDWLHYGMQSPGAVNMIHAIHEVMNSMDDFLNHRSKK